MKKSKHLFLLLLVSFTVTLSYSQTEEEYECERKLNAALSYLTLSVPLPDEYQESIIALTADCIDDDSSNAKLVKGLLQWKNYIPGADPIETFNLIESVALLGDDEAAFTLGVLYKDGIGISQNFRLAKDWFTASANDGNEKAKFALGYFYLKGLAGEQDYEKAVSYFNDNSFPMAQHYLGICHFFGYGVPKNDSLGLEILSQNDIYNSENLVAYLINGDYKYTPDETVVPDLPFKADKSNTQLDNARNEYLYNFYEGKIIEYDWSGKEIIRTTDIELYMSYNETLNEIEYYLTINGSSVSHFAENLLSTVSFNNHSFGTKKLFPDDIVNSNVSREMQNGLFSIRTITSNEFSTSFFRNPESSDIIPDSELIMKEYLVAKLNYETKQYNNEPGAPMLMVAKPTGYGTRLFKDNVLGESYFVYPNPFSNYLSFGYELETSASVTLEIYNSQGIRVEKVISNELQSTGIYNKRIFTDSYRSGLYFVRLSVTPLKGEEKLLSKTIIKH